MQLVKASEALEFAAQSFIAADEVYPGTLTAQEVAQSLRNMAVLCRKIGE